MNIVEAIKYIKNDIEIDKDTRDWFNDKNNPTRKQIEESIDAYETLLTAYEKQQKELEGLKDIQQKICNEELFEKDYIISNYISKDKIKAKIEELERRIDYLDKELTEAYIMREKLGTETEIDTNEQYIYNIEQERSIRHTQKRVLQSLLEKEQIYE